MSLSSSEFFNHGRKVWRLPVVDDSVSLINVTTNPRNKMLSKVKYNLKINDIKILEEASVCSSTRAAIRSYKGSWCKVMESREFNKKLDLISDSHNGNVKFIQNTITVRCINRNSLNEQTHRINISNKNETARKVYLKWSKYSYSMSVPDNINTYSSKSYRNLSETHEKYLAKKYCHLWRSFIKRNGLSKVLHQRLPEEVIKETSEDIAKNKHLVKMRRENSENEMIIKNTNNNKTRSNLKQKYSENNKAVERTTDLLEIQKQKIREQAVMIEELKLARLKLEEEKFARETRDMLEETKVETRTKVRCKSGSITSAHTRKTDLSRFKESWEFVTRMEARATERKKRWDSIKQRKAMLEAERIQRLKLEEELRRKKDEEEKKQKVIRMKQEKQRLAEMKKKQEAERQHLNTQNLLAEKHYHELLLKMSLASFKLFTKQRKLILKDAENYYHQKILLRTFNAWKLFWKLRIRERIEQVEEFYEMHLLKKSFQSLKKASLNRYLLR